MSTSPRPDDRPLRQSAARPWRRLLLPAIRYGLPAAIVLGGLIALVVDPGSFEGAAALVGAGLSVALLNFLHRIGVSGETDRDAEARARSYFDVHGRWPDEDDADPDTQSVLTSASASEPDPDPQRTNPRRP